MRLASGGEFVGVGPLACFVSVPCLSSVLVSIRGARLEHNHHSSMSRLIRPVGPIPQLCRYLLLMPFRRGPVGAADTAGSPQLVSLFSFCGPSSFLPGLCR